jgi:hypothetical protein
LKEVQKHKHKKASFQNKPIEDQIRNGEWHWSHTLMLVGLFIGFGAVIWLANQTIITLWEISRYLLFACCFLLVIPYRIYRDELHLERLEVILVNVLGVGPLLIALLLTVNFLVLTERKVVTYEVEKVNVLRSGFSSGNVRLEYKNGGMDDLLSLRTFDVNNYPKALYAKTVTYKMGHGILGYDVVRDIQFN